MPETENPREISAAEERLTEEITGEQLVEKRSNQRKLFNAAREGSRTVPLYLCDRWVEAHRTTPILCVRSLGRRDQLDLTLALQLKFTPPQPPSPHTHKGVGVGSL